MNMQDEFSATIELPNIPEEPGVIIIEDQHGQTLQVVYSENIRRRIGQLIDSSGQTCVHGPKVYGAQQAGQRILVRWKITNDYIVEKRRLIQELDPLWA